MANLYGVANNTPQAVFVAAVSGGGNIFCPAGSETTIFSIPASALAPGYYYPVIIAQFLYQNAAIIPATLQVAARIGGGADFDSQPINTGATVANGFNFFSYVLIGPESGTIYAPPGVTINVTLAPTAQAVTLQGGGSRCVLWLSRGNDV